MKTALGSSKSLQALVPMGPTPNTAMMSSCISFTRICQMLDEVADLTWDIVCFSETRSKENDVAVVGGHRLLTSKSLAATGVELPSLSLHPLPHPRPNCRPRGDLELIID